MPLDSAQFSTVPFTGAMMAVPAGIAPSPMEQSAEVKMITLRLPQPLNAPAAMDVQPAGITTASTADSVAETESDIIEDSESEENTAEGAQAPNTAEEAEHNDVSEKLGKLFNIDTESKD